MTRVPVGPPLHGRGIVTVIACACLVAACRDAAILLPSAHPPSSAQQTGPAIQVGGASGPVRPWTGWLYPTATGYCVEIVGGDPSAGSPSCGSESERFDGDIGVAASGGTDGAWAWGSTTRADAAVAAISSDGGETVRVPIERPGGPVANGHGYFMARFGPGSSVAMIRLLDAAGAELEQYPVGR